MDPLDEISIVGKIFALANNVNAENIDDVKEQLTAYISYLIADNFPSLIQLLYRVDIDEKKLKDLLRKNQHNDAAVIIAELICARQLQKDKIKKNFKKPGDIDGDERW